MCILTLFATPSPWQGPFAPRALPRFVAHTRQSAPLRRIGTFDLAVVAACVFSLNIAGQVLTFRTKPGRASRRLYAGCRSGSLRHPPS